jgi:hypothetical protein
MRNLIRAVRQLEASLDLSADIALDGEDRDLLDLLVLAPKDSFTTQDLRRMRVDIRDVKRLVQKRLVNIKRDVSGDFYFELSSLGRKV